MRLGQRVVQVENSHIILTGAPALNKVLPVETLSWVGSIQFSNRLAPTRSHTLFPLLNAVNKIPEVLGGAFIGGRRLYHFLTLFIWRLLKGGVK